MIKLTPSSIGVMVDTLKYSGLDQYLIFRMKTREDKTIYMRYPEHICAIGDKENSIVIVEAKKFLALWQHSPYQMDRSVCSGDEDNWRQDYKFHHAENGFAKSGDSPVPLADINVHIINNEVSCSINDGMTRTLWLLANGVKEFPVLIRNNREKAQILSQHASLLSSHHFEPLNLCSAITGKKYPL